MSEKLSRREFLTTTTAGIAAISGATTAVAKPEPAESAAAPFDTLRDYIRALDERGLMRRFDAIDQDAYEGTALMYRLVDRYGKDRTPVVRFERVKIGGRWFDGPVFANQMRHVDIEALLFGLEPGAERRSCDI